MTHQHVPGVSMARYDYKADCGHYVERPFRESTFVDLCPECEESRLFRRVFSAPSFHRPLMEHWNAAVAQPIRDQRQFDEALKKQSDRVSEYTGMEARFERVDNTDKSTLGVTDEGMAATQDARVKEGLKPHKL